MPGTPGGPIGMRPRPLPRIPMPPRPGDEKKRLWYLLLQLKLWPNVIFGTRDESLRLGSFSNDDGDGKEDIQKVIGLLRKTTTLHVRHAFLYISLPSLHDYDVKMPNCKF